RCGQAERDLVEELARRAAIAIDNARLYRHAQDARAAAESAREAAETAERSRALVAHELRTPLAANHLRLDPLMTKTAVLNALSPESLSSSLAAIKRYCSQLTALTDSLLELSRIQKGQLVLTRKAVDLSVLVRDVVGRLGEQALAAGCSLDVRTARSVS